SRFVGGVSIHRHALQPGVQRTGPVWFGRAIAGDCRCQLRQRACLPTPRGCAGCDERGPLLLGTIMIGFYQDAALQDPALAATPKRFLLPLAGGVKPGTLYLGDPYTATVTAPASIGATGISLDQTFEFPTSGSAVVYIP